MPDDSGKRQTSQTDDEPTVDEGVGESLDGSADESADTEGRRTQLTPFGATMPPRPPRRTGFFVDPADLREHVGDLLRTILGRYEVDAFGNFTFTHEEARIFVTVGPTPIGLQVGVFSVTNLDLPLTPKLSEFLLTTNHALGFGSFSYDSSNEAVWLRHTLLGTTLDLPELHAAVAAIASTAAALDDRIRDQFGGRTFEDAPDDMKQRVEPPDTSQGGTFPNTSGYL
ncbi:MAG: hypothetical protein WD576_01950 [Nitriliruptoraceae bacterium]